jgi:hypothetical protein
MVITGRPVLLLLSLLIVAAGTVLWFDPTARWAAVVTVLAGLFSLLMVGVLYRPAMRESAGRQESDDINDLTDQRRRELVRGTSLYLRELRYRYSIRIDPVQTASHRCFSAEVNTVKLGFVPVVIMDNTNDREGLGFVAFVHDGNRWRGPGLPCPAGQVEAVRHAAKCVSPLCKDEETKF